MGGIIHVVNISLFVLSWWSDLKIVCKCAYLQILKYGEVWEKKHLFFYNLTQNNTARNCFIYMVVSIGDFNIGLLTIEQAHVKMDQATITLHDVSNRSLFVLTFV